MSKVCIVIAPKDYQDHEYEIPKNILESANQTIVIASSNTGIATGKLGGQTNVDIAIEEINPDNFDAILLVGGPGAVIYQQDQKLHEKLNEFNEKNKIISAICIAPTVLAYAGILNGKKATTWTDEENTQINLIESKGAIYTNEDVTKDENIITANGPSAAEKFGNTINQALSV